MLSSGIGLDWAMFIDLCAGVYHIWVLLEGIVPVVSTLLLQISLLWKTSQ
jgi:hypothetical protein